MIRAALVGALILSSAPALAEEAKEPTAAEKKAAERKLVTAINTQASAIDACVGRYIEENPAEKGEVRLALVVLEDGKVEDAVPETSLVGARSLRRCLELVGERYRMPPPNAKKARLTFNIPVYKGAKFRMYVKGEAPKVAEPAKQAPIFQLLPREWNKTEGDDAP